MRATVDAQRALRDTRNVSLTTRRQHTLLRTIFWRARGVYRARVARINLQLSDDLHERLVEEAQKAGVRPTAWAREAIAWRLGRAEARDELAELRDRVARLERALAAGR